MPLWKAILLIAAGVLLVAVSIAASILKIVILL